MENPKAETTELQPITVRVKASLYSGPYRLEWDYDHCHWHRIDEPGQPLGVKEILHAI